MDNLKNSLAPKMEKSDLYFCSSGVLTLGVELELQLINEKNYNLSPNAEELLNATKHIDKIKQEFFLSTIEVITDKCTSVHHIADDLYQTLAGLKGVAKDMDLLFSATGSHPFAKYADWIISPDERYKEIINRHQWVTQRMSIYGLHVHLGMLSGDDCIRFNNFFMHFLPHLQALSASSPFWQGIDTGLSSCRPTAYEALPIAGQPYQFTKWQDFEDLYNALKLCGSIKSVKDLWWDLRPCPSFGTLEIRVCDATPSLSETLSIVAFIHTLAHWFADNDSWLESSCPPSWLARENKWRALRYGLDAELVMNAEGKTKSMREDIQEWLEKLQPYISALNYQDYFLSLQTILDLGTSSERQKRVFANTGSFKEVVKHNVNEFYSQKPIYTANENLLKAHNVLNIIKKEAIAD